MNSRWVKSVATMGISAAIFMGCSVTEGSGISTSHKRTVAATYDEVEIRGVAARIVIDPKASSSEQREFELRGDDNLVPGVLTYLEGRCLVVDVGDRDVDPTVGLEVVLKMPTMTRLHAERGARVDLTLTADLPALAIEAEGGSKIIARGSVSRLDAELTGNATLQARDLIARDVELDASGSSTASVCATISLKADIAGSSDASYYCEPDHVSREVAGGGSLSQR